MVEENKLEKTNTVKNKTIVLVSLILPILLIIGFLLKPIFLKNNEEISLGDINETMDYQFRVSWNDYGYELFRPKELKFALYEINGIMPREIKTINTRNCNENVCEIDFDGVMDKDIDGNPINYRIVELETYGYDVSYEDNKVINKAVPIDVSITKVDGDNNRLSGAKIEFIKMILKS